MERKPNILIINRNDGASLLEVMIAMVILAIGFFGVMALSLALANNNATAGKINTATSIAQSQIDQLDCLGIGQSGQTGISGGILGNFISPCSSGSLKGCTQSVTGTTVVYTYTYTVPPIISGSSTDNRNSVPYCLNKALLAGQGSSSPAYPDSTPLTSLGVTLPYTVTVALTQPGSTTINAQVEVKWQDTSNHLIIMNDIIS